MLSGKIGYIFKDPLGGGGVVQHEFACVHAITELIIA